MICEPYRSATKIQPIYLLININKKYRCISDDDIFKHSCIESISTVHSVDNMSPNEPK